VANQGQSVQMQKLNETPIIRPGNHLIQLINGGYYIGSSRKGFCFNEVERFRFLQYCNGKRDLVEISKVIGTDIAVLNQFLLAGLASQYLINLNPSKSANQINSEVGSFGSSSANESSKLKTRRDCDYDFYLRANKLILKNYATSSTATTALDGSNSSPNSVKLSSSDLFANRASKEVLIFGSNQFTIQLLATLQSAGFSKSRVIGSFGKDQLQLSADDISGGVIQSSDVGSTISQISKRISREHQLVNVGNQHQVASSNPALIIAMQPIPADYQQRWLSESTPHFVIGSIIENQIEIGPIILPGKTTCLRCIDLTAAANALTPEIASLNYLTSAERLPAGVLALTVGLVALFATQFLDTNSESLSPLISSALRIDLANPCKQSHIRWQPNSMCGCGADLAQYANGAKG
jgi:hypothetical protein